MRKALNENPVVQVVMLGVLGIFVAFMFMTRVMGGQEAEPAVDPAVMTTSTEVVTPSLPAPGGTAIPSPDATAAVPDPGSPAGAVFEAGPGLPAAVVNAHEDGDVVALLVVQENGIEDGKLRAEVESLRGRSDTSVFVAKAGELTRFSRIAEGVSLDRVPALVVVHPPAGKRSQGALPVASISYGFRGRDGVRQAIADALYDGKSLPYHPG